MLPLGTSAGGLDALRGRSSSVDPVAALTNSVIILTTSVDKLNDAVVDMVDVGEDATDQPSTSGRKTKRRRQAQINYKRDSDSSWLRIRTPEEREHERKLVDDETRSQRRVQFSSFDSKKNQEELVIIGNAIKESFGGMRKIFDRLISPLEEFVTSNRKTSAVVALGAGLGVAGSILGLGGSAAAAVQEGVARGTEGRQRLDAQGSRRSQGPIPNANPGTNLITPYTPEQQQENRRAIIENREITPEEERRFNSPSSYGSNQDATPVDDFIDKLNQRFESGSKDNDASPDLVPYYNQDNLNPREFETPAFGPAALVAPGAGGAAGAGGAGIGIMGARPGSGPGRRGDPVGAGRELLRLLDGLAGIINPGYGAAQSYRRAEEARQATEATEAFRRESTERLARVPGPPIPEVANIPMPSAPPADVPTPQAPSVVPRTPEATPQVQTPPAPNIASMVVPPDVVPSPQAPTITPSVAVPQVDPVVVRPPVVAPAPQVAATPQVQAPTIVQNPAAVTQPPLPLPPPAPPPAPPIPPARQPVVVMQAPQPPPYIPPNINQPRATGGGNIGRGVGFSPPPPSPASPTARTPSYPNRNF